RRADRRDGGHAPRAAARGGPRRPPDRPRRRPRGRHRIPRRPHDGAAAMTVDPLLPWPAVVALGALAVVTLAVRLRRRPGAGAVARSFGIAAAALLVVVDPATTGGRSE